MSWFDTFQSHSLSFCHTITLIRFEEISELISVWLAVFFWRSLNHMATFQYKRLRLYFDGSCAEDRTASAWILYGSHSVQNDSLEEWVLKKGTRTYTPPAFYDRDGTFLQPPSFEMPAYVMKDEKRIFSGTPQTPRTIGNGKNLG